MSAIDEAFERTREGDAQAFASWVRLCEEPLRRGLRSFARAVDVESVMQEGLLRMWRLAPTLELSGEDASLRYAARLMRNLALSEARRLQRVELTELEQLERLGEGRVDPDPPSDPAMARAIRYCLGKLPRRPRQALLARLRGLPDARLAEELGMRLNTFLQNVVRARRHLRECLEKRGVRLEGLVP